MQPQPKSAMKSAADTPGFVTAPNTPATTPMTFKTPAAAAPESNGKNTGGKSGGRQRGTGERFQRVREEDVTFMKTTKNSLLYDNTYEGAFGENGWGKKANDILGKCRGKDFRHEKNKKKRGTYRGGTIDFASNSSKFVYSDDE